MKLTHDSFSDDGEYIFLVEYDLGDPGPVEPGMVITVEPSGDPKRRGHYLVESVAGDTITARPYTG